MNSTEKNNEEDLKWWAMSATYNRSQMAGKLLDTAGIRHFIPMKEVVRTVNGRKKRFLKPAVCNLIFINTTTTRIQVLKKEINYLQYLVLRNGTKGIPIIIPDKDMQNFISVAGTCDKGNLYFTPDEINLERGQRVRIHGGALDGVEGIFIKVKGARDRRVVVSIDGVMSVASASVRPDLIEILK